MHKLERKRQGNVADECHPLLSDCTTIRVAVTTACVIRHVQTAVASQDLLQQLFALQKSGFYTKETN